VRLASTTASPATAGASSASPAAAQPLTWNRFLEIRKVRRQINVITSIIGVGGALFLSMYVVTTQDVDVLAQKYLGLDVLITMGIVVVATSAAGWLIGPVFGNLIFNMRYRALRGSILEVS
jgi:import inner membrane translocase subunit TIM23